MLKFDVFTNGAYIVEYFDGSHWGEVPWTTEIGFADIAMVVESESFKGFHFSLDFVAIQETGLYRIRTLVYNEADFPLGAEGTRFHDAFEITSEGALDLTNEEFDQLMDELVHEIIAEFYLE